MTVDAIRPPRPSQVNVAVWLQLAAVALLLGVVGLVIAQAVHFDGEISRVAALTPGTDPEQVADERDTNVATAVIIGVPALMLAVWFAATARPVLRGSNVARILVFVSAGGQLLLAGAQGCGGFILLPLLMPFEDESGIVDDGVSWEEPAFSDALYANTDAFTEVVAVSGILAALAVVALTCTAALLLALPPAHHYFVPRVTPPWQPYTAAGPVAYFICPDPSAHFPPQVPPTAAVMTVPAAAPATQPTAAPPAQPAAAPAAQAAAPPAQAAADPPAPPAADPPAAAAPGQP